MAYWTWGTWPDVIVDFGRELYIPWQLASGKVLYKDIAVFHGPLSQYFNSLWFWLFGASLRTLVICNLTIVGLLIALLYHMLRQVSSVWPAVAACLTFVFLFAFAQYIGMGNFNYVCPYAHEIVHGLMLSMASLACVWRYERWGLAALVLAGGALGLAFLTKVEVFVPGAAADAIALGLTMSCTRPNWGRLVVAVSAFLGAMLVPIVIAVAWLSMAMPISQALAGALGSWTALVRTNPAGQKYFQTVMGTDDIPSNLRLLADSAWRYAVILVPACVLALAVRKPGKVRLIASLAGFVIAGALLWPDPFTLEWRTAVRPLLLRPVNLAPKWFEALRPVPLFMAAAAAIFLMLFFRDRRKGLPTSRLIKQLSLVLFALTLLGKIVLNTRITHYGFALAMPATLVLVVGLLEWMPAAISRLGGCGGVVRAVALAGLGLGILSHLAVQALFVGYNDIYRVGRGRDAFLADARGMVVNDALPYITKYKGPHETLAVFPEGVMLNYLSRRPNPTPYIFFTPFDIDLFGEDRMRAVLEAHPPGLVAIVHKTNSEYGLRFFGKDYGVRLNGWIRQNYEEIRLIGDRPLEEGSRFGIMLMRHKAVRP
jgi:hypothetical protein